MTVAKLINSAMLIKTVAPTSVNELQILRNWTPDMSAPPMIINKAAPFLQNSSVLNSMPMMTMATLMAKTMTSKILNELLVLLYSLNLHEYSMFGIMMISLYPPMAALVPKKHNTAHGQQIMMIKTTVRTACRQASIMR